MARRKARLRRRRMMTGGILLAVVLLVGGVIYGFAGSGTRKEKEAILAAGITSMDNGSYEAAIATFEQELALAKGRIGELEEQALCYRGEAEYRLQDYQAALHTYELLLKQDKNRELYQKGAALAMIETGDYEGALALGVVNARVYSRMAKEQIEAGQYDAALASIEAGKAALEQDEAACAELTFNEAVVWEYKSDYKKALELFEAYVQQFGPSGQAEREITFLKTRQGNY